MNKLFEVDVTVGVLAETQGEAELKAVTEAVNVPAKLSYYCAECGIEIDRAQFGLSTLRADRADAACKDCVTRELTNRLEMKTKITEGEKLERKLLHAIDMERRSATRVKRAATILQKWQRARRRIERRIGEQEVRRIITRLSVNVEAEKEVNR